MFLTRKFRTSILALMLIATLLISVAPLNAGQEEGPEIAKWTFMVYLDADNNLESAGIEDMEEMETAGSTDQVNIVVQMDRSMEHDTTNGDWTGAKRYLVEQGQKDGNIDSSELEDMGEINMGDPETLINFTTWAVEEYPAENYLLVLWNHGGAFWGIAWDDDNDGDRIDMPELGYAMGEIEEQIGSNIDVIGFDACLMAQLAVIYQIKDHVDYMVSSGYVEPGEGWPYEQILPQLTSMPEMTPVELAITISEAYVNSYTDREDDPQDSAAITQAVFAMDKIDALADRLSEFSLISATKAGGLLTGGHWFQYQQARSDTNSYDMGASIFPGNQQPLDPTGYPMYDLIDFMDNLAIYVRNDAELQAAITAVKQAAADAIVQSDVALYHGTIKGANGLTFYFPDSYTSDYDPLFDETDFAIEHYWDDFLHYFYSRENAESMPPLVGITSPGEDTFLDPDQIQSLKIMGFSYDIMHTISSVEIKIDDGDWIKVKGMDDWYSNIDLSSLEDGRHTIYAKAVNSAGESPPESSSFIIERVAPAQKSSGIADMSFPIIMAFVILAGILGFALWRKQGLAGKSYDINDDDYPWDGETPETN